MAMSDLNKRFKAHLTGHSDVISLDERGLLENIKKADYSHPVPVGRKFDRT